MTSEFVGMWRNGGIGTATAGLAELLAGHGYAVTVFYTRGHLLTGASRRRWTKRLAAHGITLAMPTRRDLQSYCGQAASLGLALPAIVDRFVTANAFDIVHVNDTGGLGYLAAASGRFGPASTRPIVLAGLHSPTEWTSALNASPVSPLLRVVAECERATIASATGIWSPSRYMAEWVVAQGFRLPQAVLVQPYVMPRRLPGSAQARPTGADPRATRLVFFGRLEERKGLRLFLDAIDAERDWVAAAGLRVVFLGRIGRVGRRSSRAEIHRRVRGWRFPWRIESGLGPADAMNLLARPGSLAVMASPADNSPCTVYEAIESGIPFLAAATGGTPEIIHPADRARVTFAYHERALRDRLHEVVRDGVGPPARLALGRKDAERAWLKLHENGAPWPSRPAGGASHARPLVLIVFAGPGTAGLDATLDDIARLGPDRVATLIVTELIVTGLIVTDKGGSCRPSNEPLRRFPAASLAGELAAISADHPDAILVLTRAGVRFDPTALARMAGQLEADVDALIPAAHDSTGRTVLPLPYSDRLRGLVDPIETGLVALRATVVANALNRLDGPIGPSAAEAIAVLSAAGKLEIRPYPEVVTLLPAGQPAAVASGAGRLRSVATGLLATRLGGMVPYAIAAATGADALIRRWRRSC